MEYPSKPIDFKDFGPLGLQIQISSFAATLKDSTVYPPNMKILMISGVWATRWQNRLGNEAAVELSAWRWL